MTTKEQAEVMRYGAYKRGLFPTNFPHEVQVVEASDYDALKAENERLKKAHAVTEREACSRAEDAERDKATIAALAAREQRLAELLSEASEHLHDVPESAAGGDDSAVCLAKRIRSALAARKGKA